MMNQLFFFVNCARAGKSTVSKKWERYEHFDEPHLKSLNAYQHNFDGMYFTESYVSPNPRVVINADTIRLALHGKRFDSSRESEVWDAKWLMIKTFLHQGYDVLVDGTNTSHNTIWQILRIRENATPIFLGTPKEVCEERAYSSGQPDLVEKGVIDRMFGNLEHLWRLYADPEKRERFEVDDFREWHSIIEKMSTLVMREKTEEIRRLAERKINESIKKQMEDKDKRESWENVLKTSIYINEEPSVE